jgi:hypothetical protein
MKKTIEEVVFLGLEVVGFVISAELANEPAIFTKN